MSAARRLRRNPPHWLAEAVVIAVANVPEGRLGHASVWHDATCQRPQGGPCTCTNGPDVRFEGLEPPDDIHERN
jgi:hypothetical protein